MLYPLKFHPLEVRTIWGGFRLSKIRNNDAHGTSLDIFAHRNGDTEVINGSLKGRKLQKLLDEYPEEILGRIPRDSFLRSSILDAAESLSIQVHPDNEYARKHNDDLGKIEAWYIYEADEDAQLVAGTVCQDTEELKKAVKEDRIEEVICSHKVKAGDFICIDSGELHALGAGILAVEISTNSDTTYRFYDYHRKDDKGKERQLHLDDSFAVVDCSRRSAVVSLACQPGKRQNLLDHPEFCIDVVDIKDEYEFIPDHQRFYIFNTVKGDLMIMYDDNELPLHYTESCLIPASCNALKIKGKGRLLIAYVKGE